MKSIVLGSGRWGSFIAFYLNSIGFGVTVYGRPSARFNEILVSRKTDSVNLPEEIKLTTDLSELKQADYIFIAISAQNLRNALAEMKPLLRENQPIILCMKGIEIDTGYTLSQVVEDVLGRKTKVAVWLGPGHPQDFLRQIPNCMVIDSKDDELKYELVSVLSSDLIRFYYGNDLLGNEVGAATKNVIGIAAGMLDGLELSALKGPLMSRATKEISQLIDAMGGSRVSVYGLCHLGDYEATVFSQNSHNRRFGEDYVKGKTYEKLAEGYYTIAAVMRLKEKYGIELPICSAVYEVLYCGKDAKVELNKLFDRSVKQEF